MTLPIAVEGDMVTVDTSRVSVTHQEVVATMMYFIAQASHYRKKQLLIVDPGSGYNPSMNEVRQFADLLRRALGDIFTHVALVVSRELHYGLGRMTEVITGFHKEGFRVFRTKQEALAWLAQARTADQTGCA
jgi:hypothetical protein